MEVSIKFTKEELEILISALNIGAIHSQDDLKMNDMNFLRKKVELIHMLSK